MSKLIADVSSNNGTITMSKMAQKVDGIIIRAGYRGYSSGKVCTDSSYAVNMAQAAKYGLPAGVYWYTTATSEDEAKTEAAYLIGLLSGTSLSFPVFLDLEYAPGRVGRADKLTKAKRTKYAIAFFDAMEAAGYSVGVYCNKDFWSDALDNSQLQNYARWIARYGSSCGVDCDLWQYTSTAKGSTYGAESANLDLSHLYTDFPAGELSRFSTGETTSTTTTTTTAKETKDMDTLRNGDKGQQVRALQMLLNDAGYSLTVDGKFGSNTEGAVEKYQDKKGLTVDGICGPKTWTAILGG